LRLIVPEALADVESDQRRVEQIALNLLNNAIKFTDRGGVTVTVDVTDTSSPVVRIRVADTGIGMKEADIPTIFQPFRQIDSGLPRLREGTGLGLAICRRLTELLGGTIAAESTWGQGSLFTLTLPVKRDPTP
jgi:signal transduction histidine kinase